MSEVYEAREQAIEVLDKRLTVVPESKSATQETYRRELHKKLYGYYLDERHRQASNRRQMAIDEDFYDSKQWTPEDMVVLKERGQPALVFNRIKTPIKWVLGNEQQTRREWKVLPREESDSAAAQTKFEVLKWLADVNSGSFHSGKSFEDCVIAGLGWTEVGYDDTVEHKLFKRYQWWREMYQDSRDRSFDLSGARYVIRAKWVDVELAASYFPSHEGAIRAAAKDARQVSEDAWYLGEKLTDSILDEDYGNREGFITGSTFDSGRDEQVKFIEVRYRVPDKENPGQTMIRFALLLETEGDVIYDIPNPYDHGHFGFIPRYCERRRSDNMPYGLVRERRDAQEDYNKRRSKALHILSTRRIAMERGAVEDKDELREEAARPDGIIEYEAGRKLDMTTDNALAAQHVELMQLDAREIEDGMGVTDEQLGRETNAVSGKAILGRQQQGRTVMATLMANVAEAEQLEGFCMLTLIQQFMTEEQVIRITGPDGSPKFLAVNKRLPTGELDPTNTIIGTKADFVLAPMDQTASARMHYLELLLEISAQVGQTMPQLGQRLVMAAMSMSDIPFREAIMADMRTALGVRDPTKPATPEETAQEQAKAQAQAQLAEQQAQEAVRNAKLVNDEIEARIKTLGATFEKTLAETLDKKLEAFYSAMQASTQLLANPTIASAADAMLRSSVQSAGVDEVPPQAVPPAQPMPPEAMAPEPEVIESQPATPGVGQNAGINPPEGAL
jgi:hypothetical protein